MNEDDVLKIVSDWGERIDAVIPHNFICTSGMGTEGCEDTNSAVSGQSYRRMAIRVVGFSKDVSYSAARENNLGVVFRCTGCQSLFWYHIPLDSLSTFVEYCPNWPADQKAKVKELE